CYIMVHSLSDQNHNPFPVWPPGGKKAENKYFSKKFMNQQTTIIPISSIILDKDIYPRKGIDHRCVGIFAENIRHGFKCDHFF
ncbi:MAG: hypothetical protein KKC20_20700, partial [Proteobacteria bacterium]|nr:hypothetical protein [Pseudomonadota bacterium]